MRRRKTRWPPAALAWRAHRRFSGAQVGSFVLAPPDALKQLDQALASLRLLAHLRGRPIGLLGALDGAVQHRVEVLHLERLGVQRFLSAGGENKAHRAAAVLQGLSDSEAQSGSEAALPSRLLLNEGFGGGCAHLELLHLLAEHLIRGICRDSLWGPRRQRRSARVKLGARALATPTPEAMGRAQGQAAAVACTPEWLRGAPLFRRWWPGPLPFCRRWS